MPENIILVFNLTIFTYALNFQLNIILNIFVCCRYPVFAMQQLHVIKKLSIASYSLQEKFGSSQISLTFHILDLKTPVNLKYFGRG